MIDWNQFEFNKELDIFIIDEDNVRYDLIVEIVEYEYNLHRHPQLVNLKINKTSNEEIYPINSIMRLPIQSEVKVNFLLFAPCDKNPNRELTRKGKLYLNI